MIHLMDPHTAHAEFSKSRSKQASTIKKLILCNLRNCMEMEGVSERQLLKSYGSHEAIADSVFTKGCHATVKRVAMKHVVIEK